MTAVILPPSKPPGLGIVPIVVAAIIAAAASGATTAAGIQQSRNATAGAQKVNASRIANDAEGALKANLADYQAGRITAAAARARFAEVWAELARLCGDPGLQESGRKCVSERDRGGVWDWHAAYLDPIDIVQAAMSGDVDQLWAGGEATSIPPALILGAALLAVGVAL